MPIYTTFCLVPFQCEICFSSKRKNFFNFRSGSGSASDRQTLRQLYSPFGELQLAMELPDILYNKSEYVETASGNKVSRKTILCGSQNIVINGKSIVRDGVMIRGDLASVRVGRQCIIDTNVIIRPPFKRFSKGVSFFPLQIGEHVYIGENTVVNAAVIGSYVHIGKNCIIGRRCVLKDCCRLEDGTVLANETTVPSFTVYGGNPGVLVSDQPECTQDLMTEYTRSYYQHFITQNNPNTPRS